MKLTFPLLLLTLLAACNNSSTKKETQDDTVKVNQDEHAHTTPSGAIPELPAVPEGSRVYFVNLKDGDNVNSPVKIKMGTDKIGIDTAGPVVNGSGHHHLMIDSDGIASGEVIPKDSLHLHFGKGQTETEVKLTPGKHKLTLQFADGLHRSYGSQLSATININVKK